VDVLVLLCPLCPGVRSPHSKSSTLTNDDLIKIQKSRIHISGFCLKAGRDCFSGL